MTMRKSQLEYPRISICGTLLAVFVINASLKNCQFASAKEDSTDDHGLSIKAGDDGLISGSSRGSSRPDGDDFNLFTNSLDDYTRWRFPCYYVPSSLNSQAYNDMEEEAVPALKRNFNPWGGKRSKITDYFRRMSDLSKKGSFNPWGGKRDTVVNPDASGSSPITRSAKNEYPSNRRVPFNPWGGR